MRKSDKQWMADFDKFVLYANKHGCFVRHSEDFELWHWVSQVKNMIRKGTLSAMRLQYVMDEFPIFADTSMNWKAANKKFHEEWVKQRYQEAGQDVPDDMPILCENKNLSIYDCVLHGYLRKLTGDFVIASGCHKAGDLFSMADELLLKNSCTNEIANDIKRFVSLCRF